MNLWHIVLREISFRRTGFSLGLLSVTVAMAGLVGAVTLLQAHDLRTGQILIERERATREEMQRLENDYRLITRELGFNVLILSEEQSLTALRSKGYPSATMPADYAETLGRGGIETLNHLLPVLQEGVVWPEHDLEIILSGTPGQVPVYHRTQFLTDDGTAYRNPIQPVIPPGRLILGYAVARELGLQAGDTTMLMGETFVVERVSAQEGTTDDIAVWCDLSWAQRVLDREGQINMILALECACEADKLGAITREVTALLPGIQVIEFSSRLATRAQARDRAAEAHLTALDAERRHREQVGAAQRRFSKILVPLIMGGAGVWIFFLVLNNVRERKGEIGILRAVGVKESAIMMVFLLKAIIIGLAGAVAGYVIGSSLGALWGDVALFSGDFMHVLDARLLLVALVVAPLLCAAAGWIPASRAARQDPAVVLREE